MEGNRSPVKKWGRKKYVGRFTVVPANYQKNSKPFGNAERRTMIKNFGKQLFEDINKRNLTSREDENDGQHVRH